jgi:TRAP-type C4-dicarboxylate transport system substrate-binding protein
MAVRHEGHKRNIAGLRAAAAAATALALTVSGCAAVDRAGNEPAKTVTVTAVNPLDSVEIEPYLGAVEELSGGAVRVDLENKWHVGDINSEKDAVREVQQGRADIAFIPVRAWHGLGVRSFDALIAPLVVDSYALEREVLASDLTNRMREGVAPLGLTGVGVIAGPMRKPVGLSHPLLTPADYRKARIGISDSVVANMFLHRLGASATPLSFQGQPIDSYEGIEQQVSSVQGNQYDKVARSIAANVNLWPRPITVVANTKALENLTDQQRDVLMLAADKSLDASIAKLQLDEQEATGILCRRAKVRFDSADEAAVTKLRAAARPVIEELSKDENTAAALARIEAMRTNVSSVADDEPVPTCEGIASQPAGRAMGTKWPLDGTWTMTETVEDVQAKGAAPEGSPALENFGDWVFLVYRGRFAYTQRNGAACTWGYGAWQTDGNRVQWRFLDGGGMAPSGANTKPGEVHDFTWSLYRDTLTLGPIDGAVSPENYFGQPWRRVSSTPKVDRLFAKCQLPEQGVPR